VHSTEYVHPRGDHVDGMEAPAVGKEGDDFKGRHLHIEGFRVFGVIEPDLIDGFAEEFSGPMLCCFETGIVIKLDCGLLWYGCEQL
jgi:hypothetical protein